jgi:two-component system cell cycle sensor histidine kinase/response regulator CckA
VQTFAVQKINGSSSAESRNGRARQKAMQTILVLDDDASNLKVISLVLRSRGYDVLEAGSGAEAVRICKSHHEPIHLLIADVKVPDIPGTQVALRVIESCPDSAILFVSGTAVTDWTTDELAILECLPPGSFEILEKPFTPTALEEKVRRLVNQRFKNQSGASSKL